MDAGREGLTFPSVCRYYGVVTLVSILQVGQATERGAVSGIWAAAAPSGWLCRGDNTAPYTVGGGVEAGWVCLSEPWLSRAGFPLPSSTPTSTAPRQRSRTSWMTSVSRKSVCPTSPNKVTVTPCRAAGGGRGRGGRLTGDLSPQGTSEPASGTSSSCTAG